MGLEAGAAPLPVDLNDEADIGDEIPDDERRRRKPIPKPGIAKVKGCVTFRNGNLTNAAQGNGAYVRSPNV